jgi:excisionase family DNA binding protein
MKLPVALSEADQRQILDLYQKIQRSRAKLVGPDGKPQVLPVSLRDFLVKLMAVLSAGQPVAFIQNDAQLTTFEAARMLGVSRQFLVKLLEGNEIPFTWSARTGGSTSATCWRTRPSATQTGAESSMT